jgi:hypothetical protein
MSPFRRHVNTPSRIDRSDIEYLVRDRQDRYHAMSYLALSACPLRMNDYNFFVEGTRDRHIRVSGKTRIIHCFEDVVKEKLRNFSKGYFTMYSSVIFKILENIIKVCL